MIKEEIIVRQAEGCRINNFFYKVRIVTTEKVRVRDGKRFAPEYTFVLEYRTKDALNEWTWLPVPECFEKHVAVWLATYGEDVIKADPVQTGPYR